MKKLNFLKFICLIYFICFSLLAKAQPPYWKLGGNPNFGNDAANNTNNTIGTINNFALKIETNGTQRMYIRDGNGLNQGYIAIGENNFKFAKAPLHVLGDPNNGTLTSVGWRRAMHISNNGALVWEKPKVISKKGNYFFMAYPDITGGNSGGDFWMGLTKKINGTTPPDYTCQVYGHSRVGQPTQGTTRFRHTVLGDVRVGVNTLFPQRRIDSFDNVNPQLRLTNTASGTVFTDFFTNPAGDLEITPGMVGIGGTPVRKMDVYGRARIRILPTAVKPFQTVVANAQGDLFVWPFPMFGAPCNSLNPIQLAANS